MKKIGWVSNVTWLFAQKLCFDTNFSFSLWNFAEFRMESRIKFMEINVKGFRLRWGFLNISFHFSSSSAILKVHFICVEMGVTPIAMYVIANDATIEIDCILWHMKQSFFTHNRVFTCIYTNAQPFEMPLTKVEKLILFNFW